MGTQGYLPLSLFLFFFWDPYNSNVGAFNVVQGVSETVLNSFHSFFFILLCGSYFHYFIFQVTYPFFCLSYSAIDSFSSSRSLLNVSCIFSILFPRFWIIFTIIPLNSFSGRLPISPSFFWSGGFLPYSFICCVFLCLLILLNLLYWGLLFSGCRFIVPVVFGVCPSG